MNTISQKTYLTVSLFALLLLGAAFYVFGPNAMTTPAEQNVPITISRDTIGLEFTYLAGPTALSLFEPSTVVPPMQSAFILIPSAQYVSIRNESAAPEQSPASISIFVFERASDEVNDQNLTRLERLEQWAVEFDGFTGISRAVTGTESVQIDGLRGLRYQNEGLYQQDIYLFGYQGRIYMFVGQSDGGNDQMQQFFADVRASVSFN